MIPRDQLTPGRAIFSARPPRQVHSSLAWRGPWYLRAWRASRCQCPRAGGEVDPGEGEDSGATGAVICPPSSCERYEIIWWYHGLLSCSKIVFFLDDDLQCHIDLSICSSGVETTKQSSSRPRSWDSSWGSSETNPMTTVVDELFDFRGVLLGSMGILTWQTDRHSSLSHWTCWLFWMILISTQSGWWFGTFFIFPYIGNDNPNWLSYFSEG